MANRIGVLAGLLAALLAGPRLALAADIYGYVDSQGNAHFASEKVDPRYRLFFRDGQSFDTANGLGVAGHGGKAGSGGVPQASQALLAMVEASPGYQVAKSALRDAARRHDIDYELLQALVATESGFDAQAVSPKGALGLMQVLPATAQRYGLAPDKRGTVESKLFDPRINIATGSRYLHDLIAMFPNRLELALAAYNAGEGAVQRAGNRIPDYPETRDYVATVLQLYAYLKPAAAPGRGRSRGRIHMEMIVPKDAAADRGNMPSENRGPSDRPAPGPVPAADSTDSLPP
jgi:soluble lytic murein transglycosylase-like protein